MDITVAVATVIHSAIAYAVYSYSLPYCKKFAGDYYSEGLLTVLALLVIDGVLVLFKVNRDAVRAWHWKINSLVGLTALIVYASGNPVRDIALVMIPVYSFVYYRFYQEKQVARVGIEKYINSDPDYDNLTVGRNIKYPLITLVEGYFIYNGWIFFFSGFLFVMLDALWNRLSGIPRTKWSDFYVSIFTASMDTGLHAAIFNFPPIQRFGFDCWVVAGYIAFIHLFVSLQNRTIRDTYTVINDKERFMYLGLFLLGCFVTGPYKHVAIILGSNLTANMLFVYLSKDIVGMAKPFAGPYIRNSVPGPRYKNPFLL